MFSIGKITGKKGSSLKINDPSGRLLSEFKGVNVPESSFYVFPESSHKIIHTDTGPKVSSIIGSNVENLMSQSCKDLAKWDYKEWIQVAGILGMNESAVLKFLEQNTTHDLCHFLKDLSTKNRSNEYDDSYRNENWSSREIY